MQKSDLIQMGNKKSRKLPTADTAHTNEIAEKNTKANVMSNNKNNMKTASIEIMGATGFIQ